MLSQETANATQVNPQPKRFILNDSAGSTEIVFLPQASNPAGPQLDYQGSEGKFAFRGDEISQQRTSLGLLVTVTLEPDADVGQLNLNLVLPPVDFVERKAEEFETVAIKTRSRGHVIDPAGAGLFYRVLMLKGVAQAVLFPQPMLEPTPKSILEVIDLDLSVLESFPPQLEIVASGTVPTPGWVNPQLVPYTYVQAPPDGIYDFDFVATPPRDAATQVITPIRAKYVWQAFPQDLKGVRVHASTNAEVALLNAPVPPFESAQLTSLL